MGGGSRSRLVPIRANAFHKLILYKPFQHRAESSILLQHPPAWQRTACTESGINKPHQAVKAALHTGMHRYTESHPAKTWTNINTDPCVHINTFISTFPCFHHRGSLLGAQSKMLHWVIPPFLADISSARAEILQHLTERDTQKSDPNTADQITTPTFRCLSALLEIYLHVASSAFYPEYPDITSLKGPDPGALREFKFP